MRSLPKINGTDCLPALAGPQMATTPSRRQWYDKLADAILGEDDAGVASPSTRYALICEKCFSHNGLVKESMWEDARKSTLSVSGWMLTMLYAEYVCPKCHHFNPSARSKRTRNSLGPASISASPSDGSRKQRRIPSNSSASSASPGQPVADLPTVDSTEHSPMDVDPVNDKERSSSP